MNRIESFIETHREECIELLETLGKIPSPTGMEDERAEYILDFFHSHGSKSAYIDEAKNVVCPINTSCYEKFTLLMAHTDVVQSDTEHYPMRREGNILYAPGIGDDTANLVNLLFGYLYLMENRDELDRGVMVVASSSEEGLGNLKGCRNIFDTYKERIEAFYAFDLYLGLCTSTPVGSHRYRLTTSCKGGHSYCDFGRRNAIVDMAYIIEKLNRIELPEEARTTFNVGVIEGGTTINSIPQNCSILYEYRSSSEKCLSHMKSCFEKVIEEAKKNGINVNVSLLGIRPGMGNVDTEKLEAFTEKNIEIIKKHFSGEIDRGEYSTDMNIPLSRGVIANTIGTIRGSGAHTREEWVDLDSVGQGLGIVLDIMETFLNP
ncbi:MAG: M20/M25/M40 family metallo-hydrolase [Sphaerochaetaceae bacterium]|nr:M20/M25/M40 family metallo-hydrolase [Sphaerochaetaceae bacterium]